MFKKADDTVIQDRQKWFWRRTTLQLTLASLIGILWLTNTNPTDSWPEFAYKAALIAAITILVIMYFAMVNDAAKLQGVISTVGKAVGEAREKDSEPEK